MERKKRADMITISSNALIILICSAITAITLTVSCFLHYNKNEMFFIFDMISAGFFAIVIGQIIIPKIMKTVNKKEESDCKYLDLTCKYQRHLTKTGIELVYEKRKGTEEDGYYCDLFDEFNSLFKNKEHNSPDNPIKIIGVALEAFFKDNPENTDNLSNVIASLCSSAYFQIMFCTPSNRELKARLEFVNDKCETKINLEDTPIINQINTTKYIINKLQSIKDNNEHLKYIQYGFSPYATIIIINEHIYYTPNVLDYLSYLPFGEQKRNEYGEYNNADLSLCIKKDSEYGKRLVDLFDSLWQNANSQPHDKK
jgi:hypothetical protein